MLKAADSGRVVMVIIPMKAMIYGKDINILQHTIHKGNIRTLTQIGHCQPTNITERLNDFNFKNIFGFLDHQKDKNTDTDLADLHNVMAIKNYLSTNI